MLKLILISLFTGLFLTGCFPVVKPTPPTYTVIKTVPSDALIADCHITKPSLTKKEYLLLSGEEKETFLTSLVLSLKGNLSACNKQLAGLRNWKKETLNKTDP